MGKSDRCKNFSVRPIWLDFIDTEKNVDNKLDQLEPRFFLDMYIVHKPPALHASLTKKTPCTE